MGTYSYNASGPSSVRPHAVAAIVPGGTGLVNAAYTYDDNGNMTSGNGRSVAWTSFNKVETIARGTTTVAFDYNGEHTRIRQVTSSRTTLYLNDPASGVSLEKSTGSGGAVTWNLYIRAGDGLVAQRVEHIPPGGGAAAVSTLYFVSDHLGSIAVIMDGTGAVVERLSYDAWGKRRFTDGTDDAAGTITSQTTRGFTGHEMIDEVGLVNMNGRIYDPQIGRFMSADPFVQDPTNSQSLNRYTYVGNNPLSCTDPSGYFLKKIFKAVTSFFKSVFNAIKSLLSNPRALLSLAVGAALMWGVLPALKITGVLAAGISGGVAGYIATGTLKGALIGAGTAMAFAGVHGLKEVWGVNPDTLGGQLASAGMHGAVGCASAAAGGGSCASGFLSAGVANFAGPKISPLFSDSYHGQLLAHATVGGIAAELGGGKFANGFVTAAFGYMFNERLLSPGEEAMENVWGPPRGEEFAPENLLNDLTDPNYSVAVGSPWFVGVTRECTPEFCFTGIGFVVGGHVNPTVSVGRSFSINLANEPSPGLAFRASANGAFRLWGVQTGLLIGSGGMGSFSIDASAGPGRVGNSVSATVGILRRNE